MTTQTETAHVVDYLIPEGETPECVEDCPACLAAPPDDDREPCGESGCICYGVGEDHADCACGCDCPRCPECGQRTENCDCE